MHVLLLPSWYYTREAPQQGIYFAEQARALRRAGAHVGVIYPEHRSLRSLSPSRLRRHHFQDTLARENGIVTARRHSWNLCWRLRLGARWRIRQAEALARRYARREGRPDILHAHSGRWAGAAAASLSQYWKIPFLVTEHFTGFQRGAAFGWERRLARRGLHRAHRVLAVSQPLCSYLIDSGLAPAARTSVLPNMVDVDYFRPSKTADAEDQRLSSPDKSETRLFRFAALGNLVRRKGHHVLLEAFAHTFATDSNVRLEIGGSGPERDALERQAAQLDIGRQVLFTGQLSRESVRRLLWRADAFVQPSLQETFGVVLIEAMATGLPVVATRCGGPEDFVRPETGFLVPPDDAGALAAALRQMIRRRRFFNSTALRTYVVQHFGAEAVTRRLLHFYHEALRKA